MNKKVILSFTIICVILLISSCITTNTYPYASNVAFPSTENFKILGRVTTEQVNSDAGFIKLLELAQEQYPGCDDVVNIIVDIKEINNFWFKKTYYILSGMAIDYLE